MKRRMALWATNESKHLVGEESNEYGYGARDMLLGESKSGQTLNINADVAAVELSKSLKPKKVIYINTMGVFLMAKTSSSPT